MSMSNEMMPVNAAQSGQFMQKCNKSVLALMMLAAFGLTACGNKDKKTGQALVVVNGEEITSHQVKDELQRSGVQPAQEEAATKQLLEALIDRQLLLGEAAKDKTDRDPRVMQTVERAKAQIIAQAFVQKKLAAVAKPTKTEVEDYFKKNPQFFAERKQFDMKQLTIATRDFNNDMKTAIDAAKSLDEVVAWFDAHKVQFARGDLVRSTADLPAEMSSKLLSMPRTQLFMIKEGERTLLMALTGIKDSPLTLEQASPQIEQFLFQKKSKEAADSLIKGLRSTAKIDYLNKAGSAAASASASAASASAASAAPTASAPATGSAAPASASAAAAPAKTDAQKAVDAGFK
jgi:EpsD family peptidyl-prolyl cis-trans isomerase